MWGSRGSIRIVERRASLILRRRRPAAVSKDAPNSSYTPAMARIRLETRLSMSPDAARERVLTPALLRHVAAPLLVFKPLDPPAFPERWEAGDYRVAVRVFGFIPIGRQTVGIRFGQTREDAPEGAFVVRDEGSGDLMKTWDHWIFIAPHPDGGTRYIDDVTVKAGWMTPFAGVFARLFYAWRQHRWRGLDRRAAQLD